ncbi:fluoride efflux transporter CrcB [Sphingomonas sp. MAH-20]|uniref:Fluoride-specific ion channel FluC n=1 Tax=Sphingomonas horti TaxID=2682842 RepID=A0A6I4IXR2_9SPHN|nr:MULTISPECIES: fluoride efflux transporter CrcB [Sphingomonas]MBA2921036.1 fluoride efflux transporter CrcB [Sphingomonas sp. CGMCC 1.13658]MVO76980.1 fluoride efflux transporter CrcB [Sphingomonas horti]
MKTLLVMLGGAVGAALRYHLGGLTLRAFGPAFPWGTLIANVSGGLLMGLLAGTLARVGSANEPWRLLLGVGLLGGYTTFSAFSLETFGMIERGQYAVAVAYVAASVAGALAGLAGGIVFLRAVA